LFSRGFWSSGDWLLPRTKCQTHTEPITRVWGNGLVDKIERDSKGRPVVPAVYIRIRRRLVLRRKLRHQEIFSPTAVAGWVSTSSPVLRLPDR